MYYVYVLQSEKDGHLYVGMSQNVEKRLKEHNNGKVFSTKGFRPWKIIHITKACPTWAEARKKEKLFKSGYIKEMLKSGNIPE
jgi:putative endonuclease